MSYSNAYCGAIKGYQTKTITGYETTSAVNVFRQPCSLYEIYIRISAAIVFAADLRVFIWDYNPPGNTVLPAPVLGNSKLVMMSGTSSPPTCSSGNRQARMEADRDARPMASSLCATDTRSIRDLRPGRREPAGHAHR